MPPPLEQHGVGVSVTAFSQFRPPGEPKERRPRRPWWSSLTRCELPTGAQGMPELEDSQREVREKNSGSYTEIKQPQAQQLDWSEQLEYRDGEGGASILKSTTEEENLHKSFANTKTLGKIAGKVSQLVEWGKDNSDKFYSLTEESDLSSGDHSLGGSEDSETSETEDKTSSNEPTVRQLR
ncbi:hypothetical protein NDU88_005018 [Pleurodeles waltl]|uniref:Uncharacterized protein n=1 Tax=Pleurodeles waltl TaxID=8319 RepID=A0AAV7TVE0_PLEWA|nr:hypothetical protein NDU88_005018 [Pleurodeles waltl]